MAIRAAHKTATFTALALFVSSVNASASFIAPDSALVLVGGEHSATYDVGNIIDGSGLSVHNETGTFTSAINQNDNTSYYPLGGNTSGSIQFLFNTETSIDAFYLWQPIHMNNAGSTTRAIRDFNLEFYNGVALLGATGTLTATKYVIDQPSYGAESFSGFLYSNVTSVVLNVLTNYGDTSYYSIHEIGFDTNAVGTVPIPTAAPFLAGGLSILGLLGWRRNKRA